jgi:hypothetical protein
MFPSVIGIRTQSSRVACASNLKQIGIATFNYAQDYGQHLPQWPEAGRSPLRGGLRAFTRGNFWDENAFANYDPPVDPTSTAAATDPGAGIFALMLSGYLGKWNYRPTGAGTINTRRNVAAAAADASYFPIRFCPGQVSSVTKIAQDWGGSYFYNPHWIYVDPAYWQGEVAQNPQLQNLGVGDQPLTIWYSKLNEYPRNAALCCDMIYSNQFIGHPMPGGKAFWNLLFADCHVAGVSDKYVAAALAADNGNVEPPNGLAAMKTFDDELDILETEASGQDPLIHNLYPASANNRQNRLKDREVGAKKGFFRTLREIDGNVIVSHVVSAI